MFKKSCKCGTQTKNFKIDIGPFYIAECCTKAGYDYLGNKEEADQEDQDKTKDQDSTDQTQDQSKDQDKDQSKDQDKDQDSTDQTPELSPEEQAQKVKDDKIRSDVEAALKEKTLKERQAFCLANKIQFNKTDNTHKVLEKIVLATIKLNND